MNLQVHSWCQPCLGKQHAQRRAHIVFAGKGFGNTKPAVTLESGCPCGSRKFYKECCQPIVGRRGSKAEPRDLLRARFSAYAKDEQDFLLQTFHPTYLKTKYPDLDEDAALSQLKRDIKTACRSFSYSNLKVQNEEQDESPEECFVSFSYQISEQTSERTNNRRMKEKAAAVERNLDGSIKVEKISERSRFLQQEGSWLLAGSQVQ